MLTNLNSDSLKKYDVDQLDNNEGKQTINNK